MKRQSLLVVAFLGLLAGPLAGQDVETLGQSCDSGIATACYDLGVMNHSGDGVAQDLARAVSLYGEACDGGELRGCTSFGLMYQTGVGVTQNFQRAVPLFRRACDGGDMLGCVNLGVSYERGEGVRQDVARAVSFYQRACDGGEMPGCANLGSMFRTGAGVPQDAIRAVGFYRRACDGGMMLGCVNLGISYERGDGLGQDIASAVTLYQRACDDGVRAGCEHLARYQTSTETPDGGFSKSGRVADSETEESLSEAIVDLPQLRIRVISDESGRVQFEGLPAGRYRITAERVGYGVTGGTLEVPGQAEFLILLNEAFFSDPQAPGRILGRITEEGLNTGVSAVDIRVVSPTPAGTLSDGEGRFNLTGVAPGLVEVELTRLGYATRTTSLIVQPGRTVEMFASISTEAIELDPIVVTVRSRELELNGFYRRAESAFGGSQFTRKDLQEINAIRLSDVLWRVPGVYVEQGINGAQAVSRRGGEPCPLATYLDGFPMVDYDLDDIPPEWLEAVEVYHGVSTPIEYSLFNPCGVVLIWSQR